MKFTMLVCAVLACTTLPTIAQQNPPAAVSEVHQLYLEDEKDRAPTEVDRKVRAEDLPWDEINRRDSIRRACLHELLDTGKLKTAQDFHDAAFIYQHGTAAGDYLLAHVLAMVAVQKGDAKSLWITAASLDRYLRTIGQPQIFGTQYETKEGAPHTQEPYNRSLLPDQFRGIFCVPGIEQQQKNLAVFDAGKYPSEIIPPGCTR